MQKDLYSIIVPIYNVESYLDSCISSILVQTYQNFELILVDDGSTDQSGMICNRYAEQDHRIKVIHQKNGGASSARNTGIDASKGEWICFVDSDDSVTKDWLEHYAIWKDSDMLVQGFTLILSDGNMEECPTQDVHLENDSRFNIDFKKYKFNTPCKCFRAEIILKANIRFQVGMHSGEDLLFTLQFLMYSRSIRFIPYNGYIYNRINSVLTKRYNPSQSILEWNHRIVVAISDLCGNCFQTVLCKSILGRQFGSMSQYVVLQYNIMNYEERLQFYEALRKMRTSVDILKLKWTRWGFLAINLPNKYFDIIVKIMHFAHKTALKYGKNSAY